MRIGELAAFYGILLGHEHRQPIRKIEVGDDKWVVVGERVLDHVDPALAQAAKKPLWIADPCYRVHTLTAEPLQRQRCPLPIEPVRLLAPQSHLKERLPR